MTRRLLVVDASAIVEVLRGTTRGDRVGDGMRAMLLAAPAHVDAEVLSALGRLARDRSATSAAVTRALALLARMPLQRLTLAPLLDRAWSLRDSVALRDGLYVACAERLDATLLTLDRRLARAAPVPVPLVE